MLQKVFHRAPLEMHILKVWGNDVFRPLHRMLTFYQVVVSALLTATVSAIPHIPHIPRYYPFPNATSTIIPTGTATFISFSGLPSATVFLKA